eukprot:5694026-Ditylum_brightwellii.AAC.1
MFDRRERSCCYDLTMGKDRNWLMRLANVLLRQWTQVRFLWKKLSSVWFPKPVIVSVCQPDTKQGDIVIHVQSETFCVWGGRIQMCRLLEPSKIFLGGSGGLGCKGAIYMSVLDRFSNVPVMPYEKRGLTLIHLGMERCNSLHASNIA